MAPSWGSRPAAAHHTRPLRPTDLPPGRLNHAYRVRLKMALPTQEACNSMSYTATAWKLLTVSYTDYFLRRAAAMRVACIDSNTQQSGRKHMRRARGTG